MTDYIRPRSDLAHNAAKAEQHPKKVRHAKRPCGNPPAVPTGVMLTFQATEARAHLRFTGKVKWTEVTEDTQGHGTRVRDYEVQLRATDDDGVPVETEDSDTRVRVHRTQPVQQVSIDAATASGGVATYTTRRAHGFIAGDKVKVSEVKPVAYNGEWVVATAPTTTTFTATIGSSPADATDFGKVEENQHKLQVVTRELPRPKTWYWQARVRCTDADECVSNWSTWTDQLLPWTGADPEPPVPTNRSLSFDHHGKGKHGRIRALVTFDEVVDWDVPGGDRESDMKEYVVELDWSDDGVSWDGAPYRTRKLEAKDAPADTTRTAVFPGHIFKRYYYKARVRSIDRFNRRGDWSSWTEAQLPFDDDPPPPPLLVKIFESATDRIVLDWDPPLVYLPTHGTVTASLGGTALAGTSTKFEAEVGVGTVIQVEAETKTVLAVTSDTALTVDSAWGNNHSAVPLYVEHQDPDCAHFEVQTSKSATFATIYKKDLHVSGSKKSIKVADADKNDKFYGRVRSIDGSGNYSHFIPATVAGNSDPNAAAEGVYIGKASGDWSKSFTKPSVLRVRDYEQMWTLHKDVTFTKAICRVGKHDSSTHPADGCPTGSSVKIQLTKWDADESDSVNLFDSDDRLTVSAGTHRDVNFVEDFAVTSGLAGEAIQVRVRAVGSGYPGKHLNVELVGEEA
jgi:hypothetical protein